MRPAGIALTAAIALVVAGCGDDNGSVSVSTTPATPTTSTSTPEDVAPGAAGATGEGQPGGAGDEQGARVPAVFTFTSEGLQPATVTVPAFLAVQLTVVSRDGRSHQLTVLLPSGRQGLGVPAGGSVSTRMGGLRPGRYQVLADGRAVGALVAGGEPGP